MGGAAPHNVFGQYGNFMNDPTAQLASQFGQTAFKQGTQYLEQNVGLPFSTSPCNSLPHPLIHVYVVVNEECANR